MLFAMHLIVLAPLAETYFDSMEKKLIEKKTFFLFSYENCFGNNIVTTSVYPLYLARVQKVTPSLPSHRNDF